MRTSLELARRSRGLGDPYFTFCAKSGRSMLSPSSTNPSNFHHRLRPLIDPHCSRFAVCIAPASAPLPLRRLKHQPAHDRISTLPGFFENPQEQVAPSRTAEPSLSVVTTAGKKMQMIVAVISLCPVGIQPNVRAVLVSEQKKRSCKKLKSSDLRMREKRKGWATLAVCWLQRVGHLPRHSFMSGAGTIGSRAGPSSVSRGRGY